jgi:hypothetical protein
VREDKYFIYYLLNLYLLIIFHFLRKFKLAEMDLSRICIFLSKIKCSILFTTSDSYASTSGLVNNFYKQHLIVLDIYNALEIAD